MKKLLILFNLFLFAWANTVHAQSWDAGQQTISYSSSHTIGDGSDSKGGLAPYYSTYEVNDIPTNSTIITNWTQSGYGEFDPYPTVSYNGYISGTALTITSGTPPELGNVVTGTGVQAGTMIVSGSSPNFVVSISQTVASSGSPEAMSVVAGTEAKARFDCNLAFHEKNDPILAPGVANGSSHDHSFFGSYGYQGQAQNITYSGLRNASGGGTWSGYSSCYGGPMNRTLYWEPSLNTTVNNVTAVIQPFTIVTYYICGDIISGTGYPGNYGPANCSRWPRGLNMIFGFNMNDPTDTWGQNAVSAGGGGYQYRSQTGGWYCASPNTPSYTTYAPVQSQNAHEPWLNDSNGHATLSCLPTLSDGVTSCTIGTTGCGYVVVGDLTSPDCWDGYNHSSPNGRKHLIQMISDGTDLVCPDHWYHIPKFEAKPEFLLLNNTEMGNVTLSSDRMAGMPEASFNGHISGTTLTLDSNVTAPGAIVANHVITCTGCSIGTKIISGSGQTTGSTWTVDTSQTVSSTAISVQYNGGESLHADLFPAWDYGTGDHPGFMLRFFQNCLGLTMHVKNSDGVTYTDLTGHPHTCGFGRIDANSNAATTGAPPDGQGPNPVVQLSPDQTGSKRYFPLPNGTSLPASQIHTTHS